MTILYDAFGKPLDLKRGWGHSALVEYEVSQYCSIPEATTKILLIT